LSSPNGVVWEYFSSLRETASLAGNAKSPDQARRHAAQAVIMSVTVVEIFFNIWFRVHVDQPQSHALCKELLDDLKRRVSLEKKLREWPEKFLERKLDLTFGAGLEFSKLKRLRNSIVHFTSSHERFEFENVVIHGLANISDYQALNAEVACWSVEVAERMVSEVFSLAGFSGDSIPHHLHAWIGKVPV
jgi:hypothetical protein